MKKCVRRAATWCFAEPQPLHRRDLAVGTLYIELADRVSSSSEAVSDNLIVDFDELGKPVSVTLEHYSKISDTSTIETLVPISPALQPA